MPAPGTAPATADDARAPAASLAAVSPAVDRGKRFYNSLSASSVGLELGLSVVIAVLFGMWLDGQLGTTPWMMLLWLGFGFAAGFRGVLRAVRRADRAAAAEGAAPGGGAGAARG